MVHEWSVYQKAIFEEVKSGSGNVVIDARAGAAKTSSLLESLNYIKPEFSWLLVAFNKKIAEELKKKAPDGGRVSTLHAFGLSCIMNSLPDVSVDQNKIYSTVEKVFGKQKELWDVRGSASKTINLAKITLKSKTSEIDDLIDYYDIDLFEYNRINFINKIIVCMDLSKNQTSTLDFSDMVWIPNVLNISVPKYDFVLVDEAQDMAPAQFALAMKAVKPNGRIFTYMDPWQSCYNFAGADTESVLAMVKGLNPTKLPLPISYRCSKAVIIEAQKYVSDIQVAPKAKEGKVEEISIAELYKTAKPGCFILSRVNAPMISICLKFIKLGIPCNIAGKDIASSLLALIKKSKSKTIQKLISFINKWEKEEIEELKKKRKSVTLTKDKAECIRVLSESCGTIKDLKDNINKLFSDEDDSKKIILSSIHASKGLERDIVFVLRGTFLGDEGQEKNLKYIAATRSKDQLYYVDFK